MHVGACEEVLEVFGLVKVETERNGTNFYAQKVAKGAKVFEREVILEV